MPIVRPSNSSSNIPGKHQKLFNIQAEDQEFTEDGEGEEINLMTDLIYQTPI